MTTPPAESAGSQVVKWIVLGVLGIVAACGVAGTCLFAYLVASGALTTGG